MLRMCVLLACKFCVNCVCVFGRRCQSLANRSRDQLKCDGTLAENRFRLSAKRTSPFKSVQSTTGSRGVRISGSNAGYTMFRGSVKSTGYPLHLNLRGRQFSRLLAAEVCASAVVMLDTPCSEVV